MRPQRLNRWSFRLSGVFIVMALLYTLVSVFLANGVTKADRVAFEHTPDEYNLLF